jgi:hypothetical protein
MKSLLALIIIAGAGYVGYIHKDEIMAKVSEWRGQITGPSGGTATAPGADGSAPGVPAAPSFQSKIADAPTAPGEKHLAPPGTFYMKIRAKHDTDSGIVAVAPAEPVQLLERLKNGNLKVAHGADIFEVKESEVTNDLDEARDIEKQEFVSRGGKL